MGEIQYFFGEEQPDKDYIQEVAHIKRLLEYCTMVPGFQQHFTENPQAALAEAGLSIAVPEEMAYLLDDASAQAYLAMAEAKRPLSVRRYKRLLLRKKSSNGRNCKKRFACLNIRLLQSGGSDR